MLQIQLYSFKVRIERSEHLFLTDCENEFPHGTIKAIYLSILLSCLPPEQTMYHYSDHLVTDHDLTLLRNPIL